MTFKKHILFVCTVVFCEIGITVIYMCLIASTSQVVNIGTLSTFPQEYILNNSIYRIYPDIEFVSNDKLLSKIELTR